MSTALDTQTTTALKIPSLYKVVLLNDDFTPMDFVIQVLTEIFGKSDEEAFRITMEVHNAKRGVVGIYSKEVADQKVFEVITVSRSHKHPLKATTEVA